MAKKTIIKKKDLVLVTGANGFLGTQTVKRLLDRGFTNVRCLVRPTGKAEALSKILDSYEENQVEILKGNLLNPADCQSATDGAALILHLAAGVDKSFPAAFMNSVVSTKNLLEAARDYGSLKRLVNVSSFAVYSNIHIPRGAMLDEECEVDQHPEVRGEAYTYGKLKQDQFVEEFCASHQIPYVIVRPSVIYGPGKKFIPSRIGIDTFGFFMTIGGGIQQPLTYVENCADAVVLAGIVPGVEGEVFNVVDDDLPTGREFLSLYKKNVKRFFSLYVPYRLFYFLSFLWEKYSTWSKGQLPPVFNRRKCATYWKGNVYSNSKIKEMLGWEPIVPFEEALNKYWAFQKTPEEG
ncbi:MAG: NAD(P)-dependent oxidoreductase [bacterium]|nr:NAD(P)-dependent oxidoreductase [bacterium]